MYQAMNALQVMDRYWKEVIQVSTWKNDIKVADFFANFFDEKVKKLVEKTSVDQNVQNGTQKIVAEEFDFMTRDRVYECIKRTLSKLNVKVYT